MYKPLDTNDAEEFTRRYGKELWIRNPDAYDFYAKVIDISTYEYDIKGIYDEYV